jgi:hypothetical protein
MPEPPEPPFEIESGEKFNTIPAPPPPPKLTVPGSPFIAVVDGETAVFDEPPPPEPPAPPIP